MTNGKHYKIPGSRKEWLIVELCFASFYAALAFYNLMIGKVLEGLVLFLIVVFLYVGTAFMYFMSEKFVLDGTMRP